MGDLQRIVGGEVRLAPQGDLPRFSSTNCRSVRTSASMAPGAEERSASSREAASSSRRR